MFDNSKIQCCVFEDYNMPFDESNNTYGAIRKVQWLKEGQEKDESKAKIEIRKMKSTPEGEIALKGYTFSTPEGPSDLAINLIKLGYGDTKEILRAVRVRDNFLDAAKTINEDNDDQSEGGEIFDMRDLLLNVGDEDAG